MTDKKVESLHLFGNGQVIAVDAKGEQIGELQEPLLMLWAERATELGYDVDGLRVTTGMKAWRIFKIQDGWNFEEIKDGSN